MNLDELREKLFQIQDAIREEGEAQRIEWQRADAEGFRTPADKKAFHEAFKASAHRYSELIDQRAAIKLKIKQLGG